MYKLPVFAFLIIALFSSCEKEPIDELIPFTFVNIDINLDLIQYQNLRNPGGYVYLDQEASSGYRGIILYHEGNGNHRAFERACTFDPNSDCEPVKIDDSGLFMIHKCCNSTFNFNGNPMGGPASRNLLQYSTYLDGIYLKIRNN
jgi:hypothetical protein